MKERYSWEAELENGEVIKKGEDLSSAVRFSLIPTDPFLPQHDIVGVKMERRFCRAFIKVPGGMSEYVHCVVAKDCRVYIKSTNGTVLITPKDYEVYL